MQTTEGSVYIGLRESNRTGNLHWSDGSSFDYANWFSRENVGRRYIEECATVIPGDGGRWRLIPCWHATKFVCQKGMMEFNYS